MMFTEQLANAQGKNQASLTLLMTEFAGLADQH